MMNLLMTSALQNFSRLLLFLLGVNAVFAKPCPKYSLGSYNFDCDFCGCATTSGNFGYGTLGDVNFVGVRYSYQQFESKDGIFNNSPTSQEHFNTYQVWAKFPLLKNTNVTFTLPYQNLRRAFAERSENLSGLGDINMIGWYAIPFKKKVKKAKESTDEIVSMPEFSGHSLKFGLGIKFPTGEFEELLADRVNPGFQIGTGSTDGIVSIGYSFNQKMFGVNMVSSYFIKGENKNDYQFGNQFSYNAKVYNGFLAGNYIIAPYAGLSGDVFESIVQFEEQLPNTSGFMHLLNVGVEISSGNFVFGSDFGFPVVQDLFNGDVTFKKRLLFYMNYSI